MHIDDPDSVFKGAHKITPNELDDGQFTAQDSISSQSDIDIWRIHLSAGDTLTITTDTESGLEPDTIVALFDNRGRLIDFNDDNGFTFESFLQFEAARSGNYFVAVSQYPSFPTGGGDFAHGGPEYGPTDFWTGPGAYTLTLDIA
jgi:hypothetical protein